MVVMAVLAPMMAQIGSASAAESRMFVRLRLVPGEQSSRRSMAAALAAAPLAALAAALAAALTRAPQDTWK
jgi:hypothetical protein